MTVQSILVTVLCDIEIIIVCVCFKRGNVIHKIENLQTLRNLQVLDLSCNRIQSLAGLQNLHLLGTVNLENNLVKKLSYSCHIVLCKWL